jgi:RNA-directed DNA polymerase
MDLWPPSVYLSLAKEKGVAASVADEALRQARLLSQRDLPAVITLGHLSARSGVGYTTLRAYMRANSDAYRSFRIRKRSGGRRLICVPEQGLLEVQRWIAQHLLNRVKPHPASFAYAPGQSIVRCATQHCRARWLLKIDIKNFFESISEIQVHRVFRALGYNELISFEMARLCTRRYEQTRRENTRVWKADHSRYSIPDYQRRQIGHLPQGAPTSPMLSNLAMLKFDGVVQAMAASHGFVYTRYADDLAFSAIKSDRASVVRLLLMVNKELRKSGFLPNSSKTSINPPGTRKIILGLLVDGDRPRLLPEARAALQLHLHFIEKFGAASHAEKRGFKSIWSLRRHLEGHVSFVRNVEPDFGNELALRIQAVEWPDSMLDGIG